MRSGALSVWFLGVNFLVFQIGVSGLGRYFLFLVGWRGGGIFIVICRG